MTSQKKLIKIVFVLLIVISVSVYASWQNSSKKYCISSDVAVLGEALNLEKFYYVNSHFDITGFEITVAPTNKGYRVVIVSSKKIDEFRYRSISEEITKYMLN